MSLRIIADACKIASRISDGQFGPTSETRKIEELLSGNGISLPTPPSPYDDSVFDAGGDVKIFANTADFPTIENLLSSMHLGCFDKDDYGDGTCLYTFERY